MWTFSIENRSLKICHWPSVGRAGGPDTDDLTGDNQPDGGLGQDGQDFGDGGRKLRQAIRKFLEPQEQTL